MALANAEIVQFVNEAAGEAAGGGLPQLNVIADGSFTNQIFWLVLTFFTLFFIVWRVVLPRVTLVLGEREERIAGDLDTASRLKAEVEEVKSAYEAAVAGARAKAQAIVLGAKDTIQADVAKAQADLEGKLNAKTEAAEARIASAQSEALESVGDVATEVATDLVAKLGGIDVEAKAVKVAVKTALKNAKGLS